MVSLGTSERSWRDTHLSKSNDVLLLRLRVDLDDANWCTDSDR